MTASKTMTDWIDEAAEKYANALKPYLNITLPKADFKAGALAAVGKLSAMGVGEFDESAADSEAYRFNDREAQYGFNEGARWQHEQTAARLAARDEQIKMLAQKLADAAIVAGKWGAKAGDAINKLQKSEALLREFITSDDDKNSDWWMDRISAYFSEQAKGGDNVE